MFSNKKSWLIAGPIGVAALLVAVWFAVLGWWSGVFAVFGIVGVCFGIVTAWGAKAQESRKEPVEFARVPAPTPPPAPADSETLVDAMLRTSRYGLLLRPQIRANLTPAQVNHAEEQLNQEMARVGSGMVAVGRYGHVTQGPESEEGPVANGPDFQRVDDFYLDCCAVTNAQFAAFVHDGGYADETLWDSEVWQAVPDFIDRSGHSGPRNWESGMPRQGEEQLPVVGISWYEASAFARWAGKRLPTNAEWEKAGSCPVEVGAGTVKQRRYPWGEAMDRSRANIWGSTTGGPGGAPTSVNEYTKGACAGGINQLIGNVWEWTADEFFGGPDQPGLILPNPMRSIRGGAFDTYFDNQATCQFQSGESPMSRKHNIGFRCVVSAADLAVADNELTPEHVNAEENEVLA
ncbi:MAG: formylglycine-generating enzyme family protein [Pirellulales bacterium]|nr:formylglycine-generating enzyme family protein [Pirellulales bacterium]